MKKLLFVLPVVTFLAAGCNSSQQASVQTLTPVTQNTKSTPTATSTQNQQTQQSTGQSNLSILYPTGEETFQVTDAIGIKYIINSNFASQLTAQDTTELYLLDKNGAVVGFIGTISNISQTTYSWTPINLSHWAGLDIVSKAPNTGDYKILFVSRKKTQIKNPQGDYPADIFVDGQTKFDGNKVSVSANGKTSYLDILAIAVSKTFSLVNPPKPAPKQYNDTTYNFQLNYPPNLTPIKTTSNLNGALEEIDFADSKKSYQPEQPFDFNVTVADNSQYLSYTDWFGAKGLSSALAQASQRQVSNGDTEVNFPGDGPSSGTVYIFHKNYVAIFSFGNMASYYSQAVISSFKFTK